ncbi:MAG: TlyA family RNA methyltransferase [Dehalococcoidia bacterium]|nr:TlyA family RNA methyltransferase [Dehalococcoidia bacterium]
MMVKQRLDVLLVDKGFVESRERAKALILAGEVTVNGETARQPSGNVSCDAVVVIKRPPPYVSRGGIKLAHAIEQFSVGLAGKVAIDVGASTGGFTDCLLQKGVARVYAVDVGYGQFDYRLRNDSRVVVLERTNIRGVQNLPEEMDIATIDVSFISLDKVLPVVQRLLNDHGIIIALVKPQFEAGPRNVGKGGVVRNPLIHASVLRSVGEFAIRLGLKLRGLTASPLLGPAGNREFLMYLSKRSEGQELEPSIEEAIAG